MVKKRGKRKNTFRYNLNRRKMWKKSKKLEPISSEVIKLNWLAGKGVVQNMKRMGLSANVNQTIRIPNAMETYRKLLPVDAVAQRQTKMKKKNKTMVVKVLEHEANEQKPTSFRVSREFAKFADYMSNKYGEDYTAMARDPINYYQLTPRQIKRKLDDHLTSQVIRAVQIAYDMKD